MNLGQKLTVVAMDVLLLCELAFSIWRGKKTPDEMVEVFLWTFIPLVLATLFLTRFLVRRLAGPEPPGAAGEAGRA